MQGRKPNLSYQTDHSIAKCCLLFSLAFLWVASTPFMWLDSLYLQILLSTQCTRGGDLSQFSGNLVLCVLIPYDLRHDNRKISHWSCEIQCIITLLWFLNRGNMKRWACSLENTSSKTKTKEVEIKILLKYVISLLVSVCLLLTKFFEVDSASYWNLQKYLCSSEGYLIQAPHRKSRNIVQESVYTHSISCVPLSEGYLSLHTLCFIASGSCATCPPLPSFADFVLHTGIFFVGAECVGRGREGLAHAHMQLW